MEDLVSKIYEGSDNTPSPLEHEFDLYWRALNYRTAAAVHAHAAWLELEACLGRMIEREREACAALAERGDDGDFSGSEFDFEARRGRDIALAIRNRRA